MGDFMLGRLTEMRQSMPSTQQPVAAVRRPLRPGHVAHERPSHAELRRAVGAVLPVRLAGESATAASASTTSTSTRSRRVARARCSRTAPAGFTYPSQNAGRDWPGGLRRACRRPEAPEQVGAARWRRLGSDRFRPDRRSRAATASPTTWSRSRALLNYEQRVAVGG